MNYLNNLKFIFENLLQPYFSSFTFSHKFLEQHTNHSDTLLQNNYKFFHKYHLYEKSNQKFLVI